MRKLAYVLLALACTGVLASAAVMALGTRSAEGGDDQGPPVAPDVRHMLSDISSTNIENSINTLVSFGTRHTLSSQTTRTAASAPRRTGSMTSSSSTRPIPTAG